MCGWQAAGKASLQSNRTYDSWEFQSIFFEHAWRQRGFLTPEDLMLCARICKSWRFHLLSMLPCSVSVCKDISQHHEKTFWTELEVSTVLKRLDFALKAKSVKGQTVTQDFIHLHWRYHNPVEFLKEVPQKNRARLGNLLVDCAVKSATKDGFIEEELATIRTIMCESVKDAIISLSGNPF